MRTMALQPNHLVPYGILLFICFISSVISTNHGCNKMDHDSLRSSFDMLSRLNWSSSDCCHWEGITCDEDGRVTSLLLPSKGIQGGISPSLGNLTHLSHLNLSQNQLSGPLGTGLFSSLSHLEVLDLSYNQLSGELASIPSIYIRVVDLSSNLFNGTTPSSFLKHASNLSSLNVSNNLISGQIPSTICLSSSLVKILDFSKNEFNGMIPLGLGNCSKLEVFRAGFNSLSGTLPSDLYNALTIQEISLPSNKLFGSISDNIVNLTNLTILEIYFNQLSGTLPSHIGKLSKLKLMLLHFNNLQGFLPPSLMSCTNLVELNLGFNRLEGNLSALDFSKLGQLAKLDFASNHFTGVLPISLYSCKSLGALRLSSNDLEGQIQPEILSLESLSFLSLSWNRLTNVTGAMKILMGFKSLGVIIISRNFLGEELPDGDANTGSVFKNLRVFGIADCQLTGQIPRWLSNLKKLEALDLSSNRLTGSIPGWLGNLPSLFFISLNNNSFSGELPKELSRLQALQSQKAAPHGHGYFELPIYTQRTNASITVLQYNYLSNLPRAIYLRNNSLSGRIPIEIGHLQLLHEFDLSVNNLVGDIPNQMSNLINLERLDLSRNHLSGGIPASLSNLHFLASFSVAYNNLQGQIPSGTQIQGFNATAFEGNPGLCGSPLPNHCQQANGSSITKNTEDGHDNGHEIQWLHFSVAFGFIIGFWGVCGPLVLSRSLRFAYFQFLSSVKSRFFG
ncbi:putative non-specific serine/threonine protein kinase [Rosa chinensis]|uniref:Putative non-specific serine/threonine protein kinase n=1 Tax=Rosa chinensis TaxID=74649 RepID=A0A2P6QKC0_ROSCH|nr:receptor-like protein 2 [Rosa chinensis]PRQ34623.1 putative non-specific serine/threonine protein kinase [Rosa chinensis]